MTRQLKIRATVAGRTFYNATDAQVWADLVDWCEQRIRRTSRITDESAIERRAIRHANAIEDYADAHDSAALTLRPVPSVVAEPDAADTDDEARAA